MASQAESFGRNGAGLPTLQIHEIDPRGVARFVAVKQEAFGIGEELTKIWTDAPGRKRPLLADAGGEEYEVRRRHVLPQNQSPSSIGRKRARRSLAQADGGSTIGLANENGILATARLARLGKQHKLSILGDGEGNR